MFKIVLKLLLIGGLVSIMAACNTIEGAGQDIENAGERIQEAVN